MSWLSSKGHLISGVPVHVKIFLFSLFIQSAVFGQDSTSTFNSRSRVEFFAGPSIVRGTIDGISSEVSRIRFTAGSRAISSVSEVFEIEGRISFDKKGVFTETTGDWDGSSVAKFVEDFDLNYGTLAVIPRFTSRSKMLMYIGAGPYFSILFSEKETEELYVDGNLFQRSVFRRKGGKNFKDTDVGACLSAGVVMGVTEGIKGIVSVEYSRSLLSIFETTTIKNQVVGLALAIGF